MHHNSCCVSFSVLNVQTILVLDRLGSCQAVEKRQSHKVKAINRGISHEPIASCNSSSLSPEQLHKTIHNLMEAAANYESIDKWPLYFCKRLSICPF